MQDWGFQVRRSIDARQETDDWAFFPRSAASLRPLFGRLDDLVGLPPPTALELRPFVLGKLEHRAAGADANALDARDASRTRSAGLDAKAHLTNELTLDLTVNPDFGQVEADTVILNLSTFETFFPEKRPFFLEGIDVFATIRPLLYTRRIGRQPAPPTLNPGEALVAEPDPSTIYGAAKVSGTIGGRTTVGVMSAVTGANDVAVQTADGTPGQAPGRSADRLQRPAPQAPRRAPTPTSACWPRRPTASSPRCRSAAAARRRWPLPAADGRCTNDAYVAQPRRPLALGLGRLRGGLAGDRQRALGRPAAQRARRHPDRARPRRGRRLALLGKEGGAHWLWSAWQHLTGRELEFNDLGYLERKNDYQGYFNVAYRTLQPWWVTRETTTGFQFNVRETLDGVRLWREIALTTAWTLRNFWSFYLELNLRGRYSDDREMGDGSALAVPGQRRRGRHALDRPAPPRHFGWSRGRRAARERLRRLPPDQRAAHAALAAAAGAGAAADGRLTTRRCAATSGPTRRWWRSAHPADYRFGTQNATSAGVTVRAAYTFTPELSLQFYTQLFLASVHYSAFFVYPQGDVPRAGPVRALTPAGAPTDQPRQRAGDAERQPGVALGVPARLDAVPRLHARPDAGADRRARERATFEVAPIWQGRASDDVLMVKLAYWLG